jgi:hypothetical protein
MSTREIHVRLSRSRRTVILSAMFALIPMRVSAQDVKFGVAPPLENVPYVLGGFLFTNPVESNNVILPLKDKVESTQKVPSQNNFERKISKHSAN